MRFELPEAVVQSDYIAQQTEEACIHCGECVNRCHFQARTIQNGILTYNPAKCFGCGVCVSTCSVEAISMVTWSELKSQKD